MTTEQAARIANCHRSSILRLIGSKDIKAQKINKRNFDILNTPNEIRAIAAKKMKKNGWHKKSKKMTSSVRKSSYNKVNNNSVADALRFIKLEDNKRKILLTLSKQDSEVLELLSQLVD